jgi:hypothetical protein
MDTSNSNTEGGKLIFETLVNDVEAESVIISTAPSDSQIASSFNDPSAILRSPERWRDTWESWIYD